MFKHLSVSLTCCLSLLSPAWAAGPADERMEPQVGLFIEDTCYLPGDPNIPITSNTQLIDYCTEMAPEEVPAMFAGKFGPIAAFAATPGASAIPFGFADPDGYTGDIPGIGGRGAPGILPLVPRFGGGSDGGSLTDLCIFGCGGRGAPDTSTGTNPIDPAPVPVPAAGLLMLVGLASLGWASRRRMA